MSGRVTSVEDRTDTYDGDEKRNRSVRLELGSKPKRADDEDGQVYMLKAKMQKGASVK